MVEAHIDWENNAATYADAPTELQIKVQEALTQSLRIENRACSNGKEKLWYCSGEAGRYFQGIGGLGQPLTRGLACENNAEIPRQIFYNERFFSEYHCVEFYDANGSIQIEFDWEP